MGSNSGVNDNLMESMQTIGDEVMAATMQFKAPGMPVLARKEVKVEPIYIWSSNKTIVPSKKEQVVLDAYLVNYSFKEAGQALRDYMPHRHLTQNAGMKLAKRWLEEKDQMKAHIRRHLEVKAKANGWLKKDADGKPMGLKIILAEYTDCLSGVKTLSAGQLFALKNTAELLGLKELPSMNQVTTINFTERT